MGLPPTDQQGEHNIPLDDENGENGGGLPPIPHEPAGSQVPWQHMQPLQPPLQPPRQQQLPQSPYYGYPPLPPSSPPSSRCSLSPLSYKNPSPRMPSQDISPSRYQTVPPGPRAPSLWIGGRGQSPPLWQPWDDWTPYERWAYGKAMPADNHLRKTDLDTFWPDMLIGDQFLPPQQHADRREQMGIPPILVGQRHTSTSDDSAELQR